MADPMHFEAHAGVYTGARPPYPKELWARLGELDQLQPGRRALDLGAGTGQAVGPLLEAGLTVTAVEPGPALAAELTTSHPAATVVTTRAEDLHLPPRSYDLVTVATAIHWMDLDIVLPIVRRALDTDGRFAVWRNVFGDPSVPTTPFRERVEAIVRRRRSAPRPGPDPQDLAATAANLTRHDLFEVEDLSTYRWMLDLTTGQVRNLFSTFSGWSHDDVDRAAEAVDELGGSIVEHYTSWLIVLRPRLATRS